MTTEPVAVIGATIAAIELIIVAAITFGAEVTVDELAAIVAAMNGVGALIGVLWARSKVTPA